ncbi:MAG: rod shape-determining protein RodA [Bacteroidota bacterium]|nr:rod shape-determining protein RodA [Bacteroidota bacterium]
MFDATPQEKEISTQGYDWVTIGMYLFFVAFGFSCIYAADYKPEHASLFDWKTNHGKQLIFIGVSVVLGFIILLSEYEIYPTFAWLIYGFIMFLIFSVIFIGTEVKGAKSWFGIGGFGFQPSEFGKFAVSLALARYLSGYDIKFKNLKTQLYCAGIIALPMLITLLQNDTGSALVYGSFILVLYREGLPGYILAMGLVMVIFAVLSLLVKPIILCVILVTVALAIVYLFRRQSSFIYLTLITVAISCILVFSVNFVFNKVLQPHQRDRINVLLNREVDLKSVGYNVHQSKITIGSGGLLGKGYLEGTQTKGDFVPEQTTDFIFCTVGEEWGFAGTGLFVISFVYFLWRLVMIAERQRNKFNRVYAYSVASILFFHFLINIGMTIGVMPVIGIPLPFFSYGGSSLLGFTILLFILLKLDSNRVNELQSVFD